MDENGRVEINIDEEDPRMAKEDKVEDKTEEKVEKVEEKVAEEEGERIDVDIDEEKTEMNQDILNVGGAEKDVKKDPLKK